MKYKDNDVNIFRLMPTVLACSICALFSNSLSANNNQAELFGNLRLGYITFKDSESNRADSSAIGGKLGGVTQHWHGVSAGATLYSTQKLFSDDIGDFFGSDGKSYSLLGEAFIQANISNTHIKAGRFAFDSPHADTDDIRMVANTFSGVMVRNTDIKDTTLFLSYLDKWAGVDTNKPEEFTDMNDDNGITAVGVLYQGVENMSIQSWYYYGDGFAGLFYLEAIYEMEHLTLAGQFGHQENKASDNSGPAGNVYGIAASYTINHVTLSTAYNDVSGVVVNGFGGGPFFTSAEDHTIEGVADQSAFAMGLEYSGIEHLSLSIFNVYFGEGTDEIDYIVSWNMMDNMTFDVIYHDFHQGGNLLTALFNYHF